MSAHIVDDEQRSDRPQPPCALWVPSAAGASAALALLDDVARKSVPQITRTREEKARIWTRTISDIYGICGLFVKLSLNY
jgi:hypothetical protein